MHGVLHVQQMCGVMFDFLVKQRKNWVMACTTNASNECVYCMVSLHDVHCKLMLLIFLQSLMHLEAVHARLVATTRVIKLTSGSGASVAGLSIYVHVGAAAILITP